MQHGRLVVAAVASHQRAEAIGLWWLQLLCMVPMLGNSQWHKLLAAAHSSQWHCCFCAAKLNAWQLWASTVLYPSLAVCSLPGLLGTLALAGLFPRGLID